MKAYKHKAVRNYVLGPFTFKDFICHVEDSDLEEFGRLYSQLTPMRQRQIVEFNEEAAAAVEKRPSFGPSVIRGAQGSNLMNAGESHKAGEPSPSEQQNGQAAAQQSQPLASGAGGLAPAGLQFNKAGFLGGNKA